MRGFLGIISATILLAYVILCMVAVQVYIWNEHAAERTCAEQYQVYECAKAEEWKPKQARHD